MSGPNPAGVSSQTASYNPATPGNWPSPAPASVARALDLLAAGLVPSGGEVTSVTWRVGGTGTNHVYGTFAAALAALANAGGSLTTIKLDPSGGALVIPAGAYDLTGVQLQGSSSAPPSMTISVGVTFTQLPTRIDGITVVNNATAPVATLGASALALLGMTGATFAGGANAAPFVACTGAASVLFVLATACGLSDWFATAAAAGSVVVDGATHTSVSADAVQGAGVFGLSLDLTCTATQPAGTFTGTFQLLWNYNATPGVAFVVDPGLTGAIGPIEWERWQDLNDQVNAGALTCKCSLTFGATYATVPALPEGAEYLVSTGNGFELELRALFRGQVVELADGALLHVEKTLRLSNGLDLRWQASTVAPWVAGLDGNVGQAIYLDNGSTIQPSSATAPTLPFASFEDGSPIVVELDAESELLGSGGVRAMLLNGTKQVQLSVKGGSGLGSRALGGTGIAVAFLESSAASVAAQPDLGTFTTTTRADAVNQAYTPANLVNWSGVTPTSTADALDRIAAQLGPIL